jgi:hypothetical protein
MGVRDGMAADYTVEGRTILGQLAEPVGAEVDQAAARWRRLSRHAGAPAV